MLFGFKFPIPQSLGVFGLPQVGRFHCPDTLRSNNTLLHQIFEVVAQFGDVPVIIAGDFQTDPMELQVCFGGNHFHGGMIPSL